ncbi:hypothetical protein NHX12_012418 [Muraenolepis orangiensis]|uniref:SEFIR domain-containing protein n=1 Tax=Muraenolepis orangiensis TaxID=630683 RepID=A0A9Q0I737_9TELE|nr:hypothetical protein NHX12_012418 [Muraenolepis orangiensis]
MTRGAPPLRPLPPPHLTVLTVLMVLTVPMVPMVLLLSSTGDALDVVDRASRFNCSEVIACAFPLEDQERTVDVEQVDLTVVLCCSHRKDCEPCLQILITIQGVTESDRNKTDSNQSGELGRLGDQPPVEGSGLSGLFNPTALVKVCLSSPGDGYCKVVEFRPDGVPGHQMWLILREEVRFGSPVVVQVLSRSSRVSNLTVLSLQEVCYLNLNATVKDCRAPRLEAVAHHEREEIVLRLDVTDTHSETAMYQKFWNDRPGEVLEWPNGQREITISTNAVVPCLCFQVWWRGKPLRMESCPFKHLQEIIEKMQNNVSVSMWEAPGRVNPGGTRQQATVLNWNVTAPCRLEGEVWLCRKDSAGGRCEEVAGSRQSLHKHTHAGWRATANGHWKKGEFINMSSHPTLCIQVQLHGAHSNLKAHCPFAAPWRWRWSLLIVTGLIVVCVSIIGAYFLQGLLKGYAWRWFKASDVKGVVAGRHVVLLHQADGEQALPVLLSRLGSSLQSLGFSVALDLWSQTELGVLGPVPWLHSQLDRVQRQGGKVVLVLTQASWARADEWGSQGWERGGATKSSGEEGEEEEEEEEEEVEGPVPSKHVDAFDASLSCVLADYMQGRAGKRFVLVQFESLPPRWPGCNRPLPELFRGLCLHCLPSHSLAFLTDLAGGGRRGSLAASARRKKAGKLRVASRVLAKGLSGAGATMLRMAGLPQDCVGGAVAEDDPWETVPLQPHSSTTPSSSLDTSPKEAAVEWV